jgi:hypothetical protein
MMGERVDEAVSVVSAERFVAPIPSQCYYDVLTRPTSKLERWNCRRVSKGFVEVTADFGNAINDVFPDD